MRSARWSPAAATRSTASRQRRSACRCRAGSILSSRPAIPETFFTVWTNVFERGRLKTGESMLVHGGSSGIGTTAIQLARARGSRVFATAGSAEKCAACERLGAERAINYREADFVAVVRELTGGRGVDVVLDMVGGEYFARNIDVLAMEGRLVEIATLHGVKAELNIQTIMHAPPDRYRLDAAGAQRRRERRHCRAPSASTCGRCSNQER